MEMGGLKGLKRVGDPADRPYLLAQIENFQTPRFSLKRN